MGRFQKLCGKQNKMDCKVTFESSRSQRHNVRSTVCECILTSLACVRGLCSDPSPPPSREQGKDQSFFKVSLSSSPHHTILGGGGGRGSSTSRQEWLFMHPSPPLLLSSFSFSFPLHASGALLALYDLKNVFSKWNFNFLWFSISKPLAFTFLFSLTYCSASYLTLLSFYSFEL